MKIHTLLLFLISLSSAHAAVIVTITQSGDDVVVSHSGTIDLAATNSVLLNQGVSKGIFGSGIDYFTFGVGNADAYSVTFSEFPFAMIAGVGTVFPSSNTGDVFGIYDRENRLYMPVGYVSGATITGGATYNNATIAGLGLSEGDFTATISNGGTTDNVFFTVAVPESSQSAFIAGLMSLGFYLTRRRK